MKSEMPFPPCEDTTNRHPPLLQWFREQIETFAPPAAHEQRDQLYTDLCAVNLGLDTPPVEHVGLFVLAQVVAAHQLRSAGRTLKAARKQKTHDTWYGKERRRIMQLLQQIRESPVVASFQAAVRYVPAEDVTCPHGRNQKTCDALYGLQFTLHLLEHYPAQPGARKLIERLRHHEPHLPPLHDLCVPHGPPPHGLAWDSTDDLVPSAVLPDGALASHAVYLLGTVVSRLRQCGLSVAQSCTYVDRILTCCFGQPDPSGTRPTLLAEQWRRLC